MLHKLSSLVTYINFSIKKQREFDNICTFRIIEILNKNNKVTLKIQICNKSAWFFSTPLEIIENDSFLEKFSKQDVKIITFYSIQETNKPNHQILSHHLNSNNKVICKIKNKQGIEYKTVSEMVSNGSIKLFSTQDAYKLGFLNAMEQSIHEYNILRY